MTSWVKYPISLPVADRVKLNDQYWEETYQRSKSIVTDEDSLLLKICPTCAWSGRTGLSFCHRKAFHSESVKLNVVPAELVAEVEVRK